MDINLIKLGDIVSLAINRFGTFVQNGYQTSQKLTYFNAKVIGKCLPLMEMDGNDRLFLLYEDIKYNHLFFNINEGLILNIQEEMDYYQFSTFSYEWLFPLATFKGKYGYWFSPDFIHRLTKNKDKNNDGCFCRFCNDFKQLAEPDDQDDGKFVCFSCRKNPMRKYY